MPSNNPRYKVKVDRVAEILKEFKPRVLEDIPASFLKKYGFRRKGSSGIGHDYFLLSTKHKLVIKSPHFTSLKKPACAIYTVFVKRPYYNDYHCGYRRGIVVQPMAVTKNKWDAREAIKNAGRCSDGHTGNVGWLDGKAVQFDW